MSDNASPTSYDALPYPSHPVALTHPDRLATLAALHGLSPAPAGRCRFLELGCADGGNLLAIAEGLPGSEFVGIDLSARHVAGAGATADAFGISNASFRQMSVLDVGPDLGTFDYVVCHGVYSWVPAAVRDGILDVCRRRLAPHGVAYVSYNTYPGWHARAPVREMMRYHVRGSADPNEAVRRARDLLPQLIESLPEAPAWPQLLREEQDRLSRATDTYVYHEHLEAENVPVYFHEFVAHAGRHGLQFLANADAAGLSPRRFPARVRDALEALASDPLAREQYADFLLQRFFRQTLLCHEDLPLRREPRPEDVTALHAAANVRPPEGGAGRAGAANAPPGPAGAGFTVTHPLTHAALALLTETWPRWLPFDALQTAARARLAGDAVVLQEPAARARDTRLLAEDLLRGFAAGAVELHAGPPGFAAEPGERPRACAVARLQAKERRRVTNARLEVTELDDLSRLLLRLLDGRHDRPALVEGLARLATEEGVAVEQFGRPVTDPARMRAVLARGLDARLRRLAQSALLIA